MPVHLTADCVAGWYADHTLSSQTDSRRVAMRPATKYNFLVTAFNLSTVLLIGAVVSAIFFAYSVASVFLAAGLFVRFTSEKEIQRYVLPFRQREHDVAEAGRTIPEELSLLIHALQQITTGERIQNIFRNIYLPTQEGWEPDEFFLFGYSFWKNKVNIPNTTRPREQQPPPLSGQQEGPAPMDELQQVADLLGGPLAAQPPPPGQQGRLQQIANLLGGSRRQLGAILAQLPRILPAIGRLGVA